MQKKQSNKLLSVILFGLVACLLYGVCGGLRTDIGILLNPLAAHTGLAYDDVSFCIAVMQLVFGASQPVFGIIASRTSNRTVLSMGAVMMGCSMVLMIFSSGFVSLLFALGIMFGLGGGALGFGLVLTSAIHFVGRENAMVISGMLNAAAGMVGFVFSPMIQTLLDHSGLILTLSVMTGIAVALVPVAIVVTSRDKQQSPDAASRGSSSESSRDKSKGSEDSSNGDDDASEKIGLGMFREAFANRTFRLLFAGFSTCGFHMIIIESHLFSQFVLYGLSETSASWAFSVYGIATIVGALLSGYLSVRLKKGNLLGFYYGFRAAWVLIYLFLLPKNLFTAILFATGLGMTGDATVSPTSGLVSENFSLSKVATLIGVLFFTHQIGAFLSAWFGGIFREMTGDYTWIWMVDVALCIFACIMSLMIEWPGRHERAAKR